MGVGTAIYDFDSRQPKRATEIAGRSELAADGSNLALVLRKILGDAKARTGDSVFSCRPCYRLWKMSLSNPSPINHS